MAQFDVEGARKAGYTDKEIADFLSAEAGLDAEGARAHYTDAEIIAELAAAEAGGVATPKEPVAEPEAGAVESPEPEADPTLPVQVVETPTKTVLAGGSNTPTAPKLPEGFADAYRQYITSEAKAGTLDVPRLEAWVKEKTGVLPGNAQDIVQHYQEFGQVSPDAKAIAAPVVKPSEDFKHLTAAGLGAEDTATFGLAAPINTIFKLAGQSEANAMDGGMASPTDSFEGALQQTRAEIGGYREAAPLSYLGGQLAGAALPMGKMPKSVPGMMKYGAAQGGAYGLGSSIGRGDDLGTTAMNTLGGAGAGGAVGGALGSLTRAVPKPKVAVPRVQEGALAAERLGMDLPSTLVDPKAVLTAKDLSRDAKDTVEAAEAGAQGALGSKAEELAARYGAVARDDVDLGQSVQKGAAAWIKRMRGDAQKLYDKGEELSTGVVVPPAELTKTLQAKKEELLALPKTNKALIDVINDVTSDLTGAKLTSKVMRELRTNLWNRLGASDLGLSPSDKTRLVTELSNAASTDMKTALAEAAKTNPKAGEALAAFDAADTTWKKQSLTVKRTLSSVLGKSADDILENGPEVWGAQLAPEKAVQAINRFSGKEHRRLVQLMGTLDEPTQKTVRASMIDSLGRGKDGVFDPAKFAKSLDAIPLRTRTTLFGKEGVEALDDIKSVAGLLNDRVGKGQSSPYWLNRVKYALFAGAGGATLGTAMMPGLGTGAGAALAAGAAFGAKKTFADPIVAKMLASPEIAKRIARLARAGNPNTRRAQLEALSAYATRAPEARDAVEGFVRRLANAPDLQGPAMMVGGKEEPEAVEPEPVAEADDADYRAAMLAQEGTGQNPRSSAVGKGQFIDSTFAKYARKIMPEETQGLDDKAIASEFRGMTLEDGTPIEDKALDMFTADNKVALGEIKAPATPANLYLAHFLGPGDAKRVLKADRTAPVAKLLSPDVLAANPKLGGKLTKDMTVADLLGWSQGVMAQRMGR